jgi:hypothetical protein
MTYAMLIITDDEWEGLSDAEREFDKLLEWWTDLRARGVITGGARLSGPSTATTISWSERTPIVTDGPHIEAKEAVGGFALLEVDSREAAVEVAKSWPAPRGIRLEVRPVIRR